MSSSVPNSAILLTDTQKEIKDKVNKFALSGGGKTAEEQRKNGADLSVDVPYQWLRFFLEDDDKLAEIEKKYALGEMLTGEVKTILIEVLQKFVREFQERRAKVTDKMVAEFMAIRRIHPFPDKWGFEKNETHF